jgi:cysteine desulfurase/selenocysteine lyase
VTALPRDEFPVAGRYRYLNHAGKAPMSRAAVQAGRDYLDDVLYNGATGYDDWALGVEATRASSGRLLGVPAEDLAFTKNTTEGLAFVANGLDWHEGDRVVTCDREFPSSVYPWLALRDRGVRVDLIAPEGPTSVYPLDRFAEALRAAPTRLVAVSWVHYARGNRLDLAALAALCHEHGALLCVDAIQGLGVVPADLAGWGVDFAAADSHKWMLGPHGAGVLYVAAERRDLLRPQEPGWASVAHREDYDNLELVWDDSARRFEGGAHTFETILELGAALGLVLAAGVGEVWAHVQGLHDRLLDGLDRIGATVLSDLAPERRSGHLTFAVPGLDAAGLYSTLRVEGIVCSPRGGGIRVAPHGYNTAEEIDALLDVVGSRAAAGRA